MKHFAKLQLVEKFSLYLQTDQSYPTLIKLKFRKLNERFDKFLIQK